MRIGHHFGKRKHMWDYLNRRYAFFSEIDFDLNVKLFSISFLIQCFFMAPVVYWLFQNYALAETIIRHKINLHDNIQFEKKWIIFLMLSMMIMQSFGLIFLLKRMVLNFYFDQEAESLNENLPKNALTLVSPDEAADQRRAS